MRTKYLFLLFITSFLSFGISILHNGIYWDDFTIIGVNPHGFKTNFIECGRPALGYLHELLTSLPNTILSYKIITYVCHLLTSVIFFFGMRQLNILSPSQLFISTALINILPVNQTRDSIVLVQYSITQLLFFLSLYGFIYYSKKEKLTILVRLILLIMAALSFTIEANAALWAILFPLVVYLINGKNFGKSTLNNFDLLVLPFIYISIQMIFLKPYGGCPGNNAISIANVFLIPKGFLQGIASIFFQTPLWPYRRLHNLDDLICLLPGLLCLGLFIINKNFWLSNTKTIDKVKFSSKFLLSAVLIFVAGVAPYVMAGKPPKYYDWFGRSQSHLIIGATLLGLYLYERLPDSRKIRLFFVLAISFIYINSSFIMRLVYFREHIKQQELIELFKENSTIKSNQLFFIEDQTLHYRATKRQARFYEYAALLKSAFGDEKRVAYEDDTHRPDIVFSRKTLYPEIYSISELPLQNDYQATHKIIVTERRFLYLSEVMGMLFESESDRKKQVRGNWLKIEISNP